MGTPEVLLILAAVLILFGPEKLPQAARTIGRILEQLRRASRDFTDQITNMEHSAKDSVKDLPPEYVKEIERHDKDKPEGHDGPAG